MSLKIQKIQTKAASVLTTSRQTLVCQTKKKWNRRLGCFSRKMLLCACTISVLQLAKQTVFFFVANCVQLCWKKNPLQSWPPHSVMRTVVGLVTKGNSRFPLNVNVAFVREKMKEKRGKNKQMKQMWSRVKGHQENTESASARPHSAIVWFLIQIGQRKSGMHVKFMCCVFTEEKPGHMTGNEEWQVSSSKRDNIGDHTEAFWVSSLSNNPSNFEICRHLGKSSSFFCRVTVFSTFQNLCGTSWPMWWFQVEFQQKTQRDERRTTSRKSECLKLFCLSVSIQISRQSWQLLSEVFWVTVSLKFLHGSCDVFHMKWLLLQSFHFCSDLGSDETSPLSFLFPSQRLLSSMWCFCKVSAKKKWTFSQQKPNKDENKSHHQSAKKGLDNLRQSKNTRLSQVPDVTNQRQRLFLSTKTERTKFSTLIARFSNSFQFEHNISISNVCRKWETEKSGNQREIPKKGFGCKTWNIRPSLPFDPFRHLAEAHEFFLHLVCKIHEKSDNSAFGHKKVEDSVSDWRPFDWQLWFKMWTEWIAKQSCFASFRKIIVNSANTWSEWEVQTEHTIVFQRQLTQAMEKITEKWSLPAPRKSSKQGTLTHLMHACFFSDFTLVSGSDATQIIPDECFLLVRLDKAELPDFMESHESHAGDPVRQNRKFKETTTAMLRNSCHFVWDAFLLLWFFSEISGERIRFFTNQKKLPWSDVSLIPHSEFELSHLDNKIFQLLWKSKVCMLKQTEQSSCLNVVWSISLFFSFSQDATVELLLVKMNHLNACQNPSILGPEQKTFGRVLVQRSIGTLFFWCHVANKTCCCPKLIPTFNLTMVNRMGIQLLTWRRRTGWGWSCHLWLVVVRSSERPKTTRNV